MPSGTELATDRVVAAMKHHGNHAIVALAGPPGTGKTHVANLAATKYAGNDKFVRHIQFHPSFSYEEFVEGFRLGKGGSTELAPGRFAEWNDRANDDPDNRYVLLIDELTRANLPAVLGEVLTGIEHRNMPIDALYSGLPSKVAPNLVVLATFNPIDRSALELDAAILRRMRILKFGPDAAQLDEMIGGKLSAGTKLALRKLFEACKEAHPDDYEDAMPFGHGIFAAVEREADLGPLWAEVIQPLLRRPGLPPHAFSGTIRDNYPWAGLV